MGEYTSWPQPAAPVSPPQTPEPRPRPWTLETHPVSRRVFPGLVTPEKPYLAVPTLQDAEAAGNTWDVDVDQQLLGESADGDSLPEVPLHDVPLPEAPPDGSVGEEWTSAHASQEAMLVASRLGSDFCPVCF